MNDAKQNPSEAAKPAATRPPPPPTAAPAAAAPAAAAPAAAAPGAPRPAAAKQEWQSIPAAPRPPPTPSKPFDERVPENIAGMLCYPLGWVGGLILLVIDKRPFVRYHAAQSVVVFAALSLVLLVLGGFFLATFVPGEAALWSILRRVVELTWMAVAIVLMLKAYSGERYRVPFAATYGDRAART